MSEMWQTKPYLTSIALQQLIVEAAKGAKPSDLASLAKSFVSLETLKLRLRMKPAPKPIDTTKLPAKSKRVEQQGFSESEGTSQTQPTLTEEQEREFKRMNLPEPPKESL